MLLVLSCKPRGHPIKFETRELSGKSKDCRHQLRIMMILFLKSVPPESYDALAEHWPPAIAPTLAYRGTNPLPYHNPAARAEI
jgi:hypothetical protein